MGTLIRRENQQRLRKNKGIAFTYIVFSETIFQNGFWNKVISGIQHFLQ